MWLHSNKSGIVLNSISRFALWVVGWFALAHASVIDQPSERSRSRYAGSKDDLGHLSWLAGMWTSDERGRQITEQWMSPAGGTMLGMSRTVSQGERWWEYEFLLLRVEANGDINYAARPSGQSEAAFKLIRASTHPVVFENRQHDFPQRIAYTLKEGGQLTAAMEERKTAKLAAASLVTRGQSRNRLPGSAAESGVLDSWTNHFIVNAPGFRRLQGCFFQATTLNTVLVLMKNRLAQIAGGDYQVSIATQP